MASAGFSRIASREEASASGIPAQFTQGKAETGVRPGETEVLCEGDPVVGLGVT